MSVSGIRGVVGEGLTPEVVATFAAAHGAAARRRTDDTAVVVGRDARVSGPMLVAAASAGLRSVGCDVLDVGLAATPTILLAVEDAGAAGGIAVTASHNPAQWNALKLASHRGMFLTSDEAREVLDAADSDDIPRAAWDALGTETPLEGATGRHVERILSAPLVDVEAVRARRFTVVLDACAGVGAVAAVPLLEALGARVVGLHLEPTGRFPHDPEPTAEHLTELAEKVRETGADLGLAFDPDGDRLALVDETGRAVGEDLTLALAVDAVLSASEHPGPVVTNLSTSQVVERVAEAHGARVQRTAVGEINVALGMRAAGSAIGGEGNGGVIYAPVHHTRDAAVGIALVLTGLAHGERTLSEEVARWPAYAIRKAKLPLAGLDPDRLLEAAEDAFPGAEVDRTDGLRLAWPGRAEWLHLRKSGTEPVVRVIAEAPDPEAAEGLLDQARELARA